jgi:hypothetical protein
MLMEGNKREWGSTSASGKMRSHHYRSPLSLYLKQERRMVYKTARFRDDERPSACEANWLTSTPDSSISLSYSLPLIRSASLSACKDTLRWARTRTSTSTGVVAGCGLAILRCRIFRKPPHSFPGHVLITNSMRMNT